MSVLLLTVTLLLPNGQTLFNITLLPEGFSLESCNRIGIEIIEVFDFAMDYQCEWSVDND